MEKNIVPDWKLERYLLGELPARELEDIRILEGTRGGIWERLEALRAENGAILNRYPPEAMGRKIEKASAVDKDGVSKRRLAVRRYSPSSVPFWAIPAVICLAALLIVPIRLFAPSTPIPGGIWEDRVKGASAQSIEVWRKNGAEAERLQQEALARSGDVVQLRYIVPEFCYGALISVDGRGVLTVHLSGESDSAAPLTPGRPIALNSSYQLDDAPLFETFYLVTAKDNFDIESVKRSLLDKKYLPKDQLVTAFTLRK